MAEAPLVDRIMAAAPKPIPAKAATPTSAVGISPRGVLRALRVVQQQGRAA